MPDSSVDQSDTSRITDEMIERAADEIEAIFQDVFDIASVHSVTLNHRDRLDDARRILAAALREDDDA